MAQTPPPNGMSMAKQPMDMTNAKRTTPEDRAAAAQRAKAARATAARNGSKAPTAPTALSTPDYFGPWPNYANSQFPQVDGNGQVISGTGIRKFVDSLPGLTDQGANNLGQYIPVALADATTYPGSDYYEIALVQYGEKLHTDILTTTLRGYVQLETATNITTSKHIVLRYPNGAVITNTSGQQVFGYDRPSYLGPTIVATRNRPTRIKFTNYLPTGSGGDLYIPVDTTAMGAGAGPRGGTELYKENRATLHLHGGLTPWISDGTPHQWTTPAGELTSYPKGVSVSNVPDMPDPGPGSLTFFYSNQQSARLMFYHDHAYGVTRLNVYAGEAAGYVLTDPTEQALISNTVLPGIGIPLIIQDKTFVPPAAQLAQEDPTWDSAKYGGQGNLWFPHVYMPNQNPWDLGGAAAMGRWDYGPWFWPPYTGLVNGPVANPYAANPGEPPQIPGTPNPSLVPEGFMDTPVINGTVYPYMTVQPKAYRFRILNAANDRFWNLQLYQAASNNPMWNPDGTLNDANAGEVSMVPAIATPGYPATWPADGREGGVPDPFHRGPSMIQIGTEGGFLPSPVELPNQPVDFVYNRRDIVVLNVSSKTLFLGPAERADVIVDFSQYAGKTLILYNDSPAPVPAFDPRNDYYTGAPDHSLTGDGTGGAPSTLPGYGPNTRTLMQIRVASVNPVGDALSNVQVTNAGAGYIAMPMVNFTGGGISATSAIATATGAVDRITIVTPGSGYTSVPSVTLTGGGAITPAVATAVIRNGLLAGVIINDGGAGYTAAPTVQIVGGGTVVTATATATLKVTAINMSNGGANYTSAPSVDLLGGAGYGAEAAAMLAIGTPYNRAALDAAFAGANSVFATSLDPIIVPQAAYNSAYGANFPADAYVRIQDTSITFTPAGAPSALTLGLEPKAIQELFETEYGRMNAILGVELPNTSATIQTTIPYGYIDPVTEVLNDSITPMSPVLGDGTQIWKITHNGVDTHAIHFHLVNVQLLNRVGWDGAIRPPDANELGWKETVRMNPLEDAIVAMRAVAPQMPFGVPDSIRPLDPTRPLGSGMGFTNVDPNGNPVTTINQIVNFGWEYVWHCHLLGHEENDMMRPLSFNVVTNLPGSPSPLSANTNGSTPTAPRVNLQWTDATTALGNPANEVGFRVERALGTAANASWLVVATTRANQTSYVDTSVGSTQVYRYRVVAFNASGDTTSNVVQLTTIAGGLKPVAPTNLVATAQSGPRVALSWTDNATGETGFAIERAANGGAFTALTTVGPRGGTGNVTYTDATVQVGNTYAYRVRAYRGAVFSAYSNVASAEAGPTAPTNLISTARTTTSISMRWTRNQNVPPATGYEVWRSTNGANFTQVGAVVGNLNTYTDNGLTTGTRYYYQVRTYFIGVVLPTLYTSSWSNTLSVVTQ
jgi:FtsP/CotA-like multicopper oxidase with cupredoxin domain/fibronectin type 3 domain-containing protein